ncbi:GNAT family N-acetyltransferase [Flavobacterium sp.]|uniref:GNAT family N-acetyltransferase n=1 Tax=Flavobacterium sp. TaxID=239 RepID=UPI00260F85C9|nr:GNAT family N-acetyltransferase [Flavobacterium sp.]MDD2986143.1 GNAT family N-acetyltransferase [Flavobacterium sp.]
MGKTYLLKKEDFNYDEELKNEFILKETLTNDEAKGLIELQTKVSSEISEEITILTESALTTKSPYSFPGLIYCLVKFENKCIGYGYGYIDDDKKTFYIYTIGVDSEHRGKKIGTEIKLKLIRHAFENPKIEYVKAITQDDNEKTIHINTKLGFKDSL